MSKRAIILAGGKGSRLQPYTVVLPKPLMPIGDLPILEVLLWQMKAASIKEVIHPCIPFLFVKNINYNTP